MHPSKLVIGSPQVKQQLFPQLHAAKVNKSDISSDHSNNSHNSHNSHNSFHSHSYESHKSVNAPVFNSSVKMFSVLDRSTSSMSLLEARGKNKQLGMKELDDHETDGDGSDANSKWF